MKHLRSQRLKVTRETKRYNHYLRIVPGVGSEDRIFYQPMMTGLDTVRGVVSQPSTAGTGTSNPLGGKDNEPLASTHQVRPLIAAHIVHDTHSSYRQGYSKRRTEHISCQVHFWSSGNRRDCNRICKHRYGPDRLHQPYVSPTASHFQCCRHRHC